MLPDGTDALAPHDRASVANDAAVDEERERECVVPTFQLMENIRGNADPIGMDEGDRLEMCSAIINDALEVEVRLRECGRHE